MRVLYLQALGKLAFLRYIGAIAATLDVTDVTSNCMMICSQANNTLTTLLLYNNRFEGPLDMFNDASTMQLVSLANTPARSLPQSAGHMATTVTTHRWVNPAAEAQASVHEFCFQNKNVCCSQLPQSAGKAIRPIIGMYVNDASLLNQLCDAAYCRTCFVLIVVLAQMKIEAHSAHQFAVNNRGCRNDVI